jgi:hypothetical protein
VGLLFPFTKIPLLTLFPTATSKNLAGTSVPIPTEPIPVIRTLSLPAVSTVNVSAAGNLIAVSVSPVWMILSAIEKSPDAPDASDAVPVTSPVISPTKEVAVTTPTAVIPPPTTTIPSLAVITPTESILVTSS